MIRILVYCSLLLAGSISRAATFGQVVVIGGQASDLAFDARRNLLYIANYTGMRIDVLSAADRTLGRPMRLGFLPAAIALSPDDRFLVAAHPSSGLGAAGFAGLTIMDLDAGSGYSVMPLPSPPLAVAFGNSNIALVVTTSGLFLLDPFALSLQPVAGPNLECSKLPVDLATFPSQITRAAYGVSGDGNTVVIAAEHPGTQGCTMTGTPAETTATMLIRYNVATGELRASSFTASPPLGPRVVSVDRDGSSALVGWALIDQEDSLLAQFPYAKGAYQDGGHAFDPVRNVVYASVPSSLLNGDPFGPVLHIMEPDNLAVRERIRLAEPLAGKAILSPNGDTLYAISQSGVIVLPLNELETAPRLSAREEQLLFLSNSCGSRAGAKSLHIENRGGAHAAFSLSVDKSVQGVRFSQSSGTAPAEVMVEVDASAFQSEGGTVAFDIQISSPDSVSIPDTVRVLVNRKEPDQRGEIHPLPGKIVDLLSDPYRNRLYALRQDKNQVLVLDATSFEQIAVLRTGNTPTQMTFAYDAQVLLVANDNSQIANLYDLNALRPMRRIAFPHGHYPRSIAAANGVILAVARNIGDWPCTTSSGSGSGSPAPAMIDRIDLSAFTASPYLAVPQYAPPSCLGVWVNNVPLDSVMVASPTGQSIFTAAADGTVLLYDSSYDTYLSSRKDVSSLAGSIGAVSDDLFIAGGNLFNRSLVRRGALPGSTTIAGIGGDATGVMLLSANASTSAGTVQTYAPSTGTIFRPVRSIEAPITPAMLRSTPVGQMGQTIPAFLRTVARTEDGTTVYISVSGLTALPAGFDQSKPGPVIASVGNLADGGALAPGSLVRIFGSNISGGNGSASATPLPRSLADTCATVNGSAVPLLAVMPDHIEAQLPFEVGPYATFIVITPGGRSVPFTATVQPVAPAIFRMGTPGPSALPLIYRSANNDVLAFSNPVHAKDTLMILATGLGRTSNQPASGDASPLDPLALALTPPVVSIGDTRLEITYAGLAPGQVGVYQINATVPYNIPEAVQVPLTITVGNVSTNVLVRVVKP